MPLHRPHGQEEAGRDLRIPESLGRQGCHVTFPPGQRCGYARPGGRRSTGNSALDPVAERPVPAAPGQAECLLKTLPLNARERPRRVVVRDHSKEFIDVLVHHRTGEAAHLHGLGALAALREFEQGSNVGQVPQPDGHAPQIEFGRGLLDCRGLVRRGVETRQVPVAC